MRGRLGLPWRVKDDVIKESPFAIVVAFQIVAAVASAAPKAAQTQAAAGKIPVSSASDEARSAFFKDRDLAEKLRATDGRQYYLKASELDPKSALGPLGLANTAPTAAEFFAGIGKASSLADAASPGEAHMIRTLEAGVNG